MTDEPQASEIPPADEMTPQELAEARQYGRQRLIVGLVDKLVDVAVLVVAALLLARPLDSWLAGYIELPVLRLLALFACVALLDEITSLPLAWYSGYVLEHRYGMSRQTFARWAWRQCKRFVLSAMVGAGLTVALFALIWFVGQYWWLAASAAFFLFAVVAGQLAPVLIIPLFYKVRRLPTDETTDDGQPANAKASELARRMRRLVQGTGLSIDGIYQLQLSADTVKANAMLAGLGGTRRVLLGDTLLADFSVDEIEVVFAHEVGHHVHRHIPKLIGIGLAFSLVAFWLADRLLAWWIGPDVYDPAQMPVYALPMLMLVMTVLGLLFEPLQNTISRFFERQCDRYALDHAEHREAYTSAFRKLARLNKADPQPHPVEVFLFHSHPPIAQRLAMADDRA